MQLNTICTHVILERIRHAWVFINNVDRVPDMTAGREVAFEGGGQNYHCCAVF